MRTEIHELHGRLGFTAVYVTHDQTEALALGDRLAIMRSGALEQLGRPDEIFEEPATEYVADFIGMANRLVFERHDGRWTYDGEPFEGDLGRLDTASPTIVARTRSRGRRPRTARKTPTAAGTVAFPRRSSTPSSAAGTSTSSSRSARRACLSRIPAGERGGWARSLNAGQQVLASLRTGDVAFYDDSGALIGRAGRPAAVAS